MAERKGSYKVRRLKRRIHRKWWVLRLRIKYQIRLGIYFGISKIYDLLFPNKTLKITKIGKNLYEAKK